MSHKFNRAMHKGPQRPHRPMPTKADRPWRILDKTTDDPLTAAPVASSWLVIMAAPRREADAAASLADAGYLVWYPRMTMWRTQAARRLKTKLHAPLFSRYLFVSTRAGCAKPIVDCDHVTYIVGPVSNVRKGMLEALSDKQQQGDFDATFEPPAPPPLEAGDIVDIMSRPGVTFDGLMRGIVLRSDADRTQIALTLFGRTMETSVSTTDLKPVLRAVA